MKWPFGRKRKRETEQLVQPGQPGQGQHQQRPQLTQRADLLLANFSQQPGVTARHMHNLRSVVNSSPSLIGQLNRAVAQDDLRSFGVMAAGVHAGAQFAPDARQVQMPLTMLDDGQQAEAAFVLAHEAQHALNRPALDQARRQFEAEAWQQAQPQASNDYTNAITNHVQAQRWDEARANLAGWNSLVENVRSQHPQAGVTDIAQALPARSEDFVERTGPFRTLQPKQNLSFGPDSKLDPTPANEEGMAQNFFDRGDDEIRLGQSGAASYRNYYAAWSVGTAAFYHRRAQPPQPGVPEKPMRIDLTDAGFDLGRMHGSGIDLQQGPPIPFVDQTAPSPMSGMLHHTKVAPTSQQPINAAADTAGADNRTVGARDHRVAQTTFARPATAAVLANSPTASAPTTERPTAANDRSRGSAASGIERP